MFGSRGSDVPTKSPVPVVTSLGAGGTGFGGTGFGGTGFGGTGFGGTGFGGTGFGGTGNEFNAEHNVGLSVRPYFTVHQQSIACLELLYSGFRFTTKYTIDNTGIKSYFFKALLKIYNRISSRTIYNDCRSSITCGIRSIRCGA